MFPLAQWETVTFVAGLRHTGIIAPMLINGCAAGSRPIARQHKGLELCGVLFDAKSTVRGSRVVRMAARRRSKFADLRGLDSQSN